MVTTELVLDATYVPFENRAAHEMVDTWDIPEETAQRLHAALDVAEPTEGAARSWALIARPLSGRLDAVLTVVARPVGARHPASTLQRWLRELERDPSPGTGAGQIELSAGSVVLRHEYPVVAAEEGAIVSERAMAHVFPPHLPAVVEVTLITQDLAFFDDIVRSLGAIVESMTVEADDAD